MAPFPASSVVDKRQVPILLRLKGETANDEFADDLRLRDIQLIIAQVCYFGIVHQEGQTVVDHAKGKRVPGFANDQALLPKDM